MTKVSWDEVAMDDGDDVLVHENGRRMEWAGEHRCGEWFACDGDDCYAQGYYERENDTMVILDEHDDELARIAAGDEEALLAWAEGVLA